MSLINDLRQRNPNLKNYSDQEIAQSLRRRQEYKGLPEPEFEALAYGTPEPVSTDRNSETIPGLIGDTIDAAQMGAYQTAQGLGEFAYEHAGVGRGLRDYGQGGAERQLEQMSPRATEAIQQEIFESTGPGLWDFQLGEGANPLTVFLQTASMAGEALTTGLGAGGIARGGISLAGRSVGKGAYQQAIKKGADEATARTAAQAAAKDFAKSKTAGGIKLGSYGLGEMAINTGQIADGARQEVLAMPDDELDQSDAFASTYWDIAEQNPDASVAELRQQAKQQLADASASLVMRDPALLLSTAALGGYGGKVLDDIVTKGTGAKGGRLAEAVRQGAIQFSTEAGMGAEGKYATNLAIAESGADPDRLPTEGVTAAGLSEGTIGGVMGVGAGVASGSKGRKDRIQQREIEAARQQAAAQGGDALDQTMAGQQAETASQPETPETDPAQVSDLGNRLQMAMGGLDELQSLAKGSEFEGQTRLRNVNRLLDNAEKAFEDGDYDRADTLLQRADKIAVDLRANLQRVGSRERPMSGEIADDEPTRIAGQLGQDRQGRLPPSDPSTIYGEGPTADQTQYDPQARTARRDERMAAQREGAERLRDQVAGQRPQLEDSGTIYGDGPVAGNANTGMDQPARDPRFASQEESQSDWEQAWRDQGMEDPSADLPETTIDIRGRREETPAAERPAGAQRSDGEVVHTMPDGTTMAGPEHEGAVPGTTRADQDADDTNQTAEPAPDVRLMRSGRPFATQRSAELGREYQSARREGRDAQAIEVPGGWGVQVSPVQSAPLAMRANGQPFATEASALASGTARRGQAQRQQVEAVQVDGGFAVRVSEPVDATDTNAEPVGETADNRQEAVDTVQQRADTDDRTPSRGPSYDTTAAGEQLSAKANEGRDRLAARRDAARRADDGRDADQRSEAAADQGRTLDGGRLSSEQVRERISAARNAEVDGLGEGTAGDRPGPQAPVTPSDPKAPASQQPADDATPAPKRRIKPLTYTGYSGEERSVRSYQQVGDYRIAKVHDGLHEVIDGDGRAVSQMAGPDGAVREARRLGALPADTRFAMASEQRQGGQSRFSLANAESLYPEAGRSVSGLTVRDADNIPNTSSIAATLDDYTTLPGIREVPVSAFDSIAPKDLFYAANDRQRVRDLAAAIRESGGISPLIVVVDAEGPYILEGAHRAGALHDLGVDSIPAMVVLDNSDMDDTRFRTGEPDEASPGDALLSVEEVEAALQGYDDALGAVNVVRSTSQLPADVLLNMKALGVSPMDVKGVHHNGEVYIVAAAHDNAQEALRTAVHEAVGHKGMRGVLGEDLDRVMLGLFRSLPNSPEGRAAMAEVRRDYPFLDPSKREDRITIGEEMVAHLLEKGHRPKAWQRAVAKIRELLRRMFPSIAWTHTDALALGEQSREYLRRQTAERQAEQARPTITRYSQRGGENKLFTPIQQEAEAYREALDKAMTSLRSVAPPIQMGRTPPVLAQLGAPDLPMQVTRDVVRKATNGVKHSVGMDTMAQLPELLHDPVAVFRSRTEEGAMTVLVDSTDSDGQPVLAALHLKQSEGRQRIEINRVASAYGAREGKLAGFARDGLTLYLNARKNPDLVRRSGVQFPGRGSPNQGSDQSILTPDDIGKSDVRFSLRGKQRVAFEESFDDFDADDKAAAGKIGEPTISQNVSQWWQEKTDRWRAKVRQGVVDQYGPLMDQDLALYGDETLKEKITQSAWVKARMSKSANGVTEVLLKDSRIEWNAKEQVFQPKDDDSMGLGAVLGRLGDSAEVHRFLGWIAGNRADKLRAEGRENLFEDKDIDAMKTWDRGNLEDGRARREAYEQVFKEFQQYRDDVLAAGEALGVISSEQRAEWRDEFYVPFYRISDEKGFQGGQLATSGLSRQQAIKKLKGGTANLNNLLENTFMNMHHIIEAGLKNNAARQAIQNSEQLGVAHRVPESAPKGDNTTFIMENGKKAYYQVDDPLVYNAITALGQSGMNSSLMKLMRGFKRIFTNTVTVTPQYMLANLFRDTIQAPATSDISKNVLKNILIGNETLRDRKMKARMLASGANFSFGHLYGTGNTDEIRSGMTRNLRDAGVAGSPGATITLGVGRVASAVRQGWAKWNDANNHFENINRAAIYRQGATEGNQLRAAFEARDLMDFSSHGSWGATRVLIDIIPFLNARIQGLDKIYRTGVKPGASVLSDALSGNTPNANDKQVAGRFWAVAGAVSIAMLALYLNNYDEEWYKELEEWEKDTYTHFKIGDNLYRLPNPFEVGAIGTMMVRTAEQFVNDEATGELFVQRMGHMVNQTFAVGLPQIMQPAMDVYSNRDSFTGRPIENMGMQNLSPELRKRYNTTSVATGISNVLNSTVGAIGNPESNPLALSPVQVDHLIGGYLGQIGAWGAGMADTIWRTANGHDAPDRKWYEFNPIRRFYQNLDDVDGYTRYGTLFYDGLTETRRAYSDVKELRELGRMEEASERIESNRSLLAIRKGLNRAQRTLSKYNKQVDIIRRDDSISGELKRQRIDRIQAKKAQLQRIWGERIQGDRTTSRTSQ